jgi:hypothetical protein
VVCNHAIQDGLHQRIIGIDQHVVSLKAIELKRKVDDFKVGTAKQGMPEIEPDIRDLSGNLLFGSQREKRARPPSLFDHAEGKAGGVSVDERVHK